jgi:hypothetical protein
MAGRLASPQTSSRTSIAKQIDGREIVEVLANTRVGRATQRL